MHENNTFRNLFISKYMQIHYSIKNRGQVGKKEYRVTEKRETS